MLQETFEEPVSVPSFSRDINLDCCTQQLSSKVKIQLNQMQLDRINLLNGDTAYIIKSHDEYSDAFSKLWWFLKDAMPSTYGNLVCSPMEILCAAINCIQMLKGVQEKEVPKNIANIKTSLDSEDKSSPIMWNYDTYIPVYYKLWKLVKSVLPTSYQSLIFLPPQIFCGAMDCIQMLKSKQEVEFQKVTVNVEHITDPLGNSSFAMRSCRELAEAFYKLWKVLRTVPDIYKMYNYVTRFYLQAVFSPSQILCSAIDYMQVMKSMQVVAVTEAPEEEYDPSVIEQRRKEADLEESHRLEDLLKGLHDDDVPFLELIDETQMKMEIKLHNKMIEYQRFRQETFRQCHGSEIKCEHILLAGALKRKATSPLFNPKKKQATSFTNIKIALYSNKIKPFPIMWTYPDYIEAYYEIWNMLKDIMPLTYEKLIFSPLHILYGAIDCIQKLKIKQKDKFQKIFADIETALYSEDPFMESCQKRIDDYFELWKEIKKTMPDKYGNLRFQPVYIDYAAADCIKRGHQLLPKENK